MYNVLLFWSGCSHARQLLVFIKVPRASEIKHITGSLVEFSKKYLIDNIWFCAHLPMIVARFTWNSISWMKILLLSRFLLLRFHPCFHFSESPGNPTRSRSENNFLMTWQCFTKLSLGPKLLWLVMVAWNWIFSPSPSISVNISLQLNVAKFSLMSQCLTVDRGVIRDDHVIEQLWVILRYILWKVT